MTTPNTNTPSRTIPSPPPSIDEVKPVQHEINAKPKPGDVNGGMMTSTNDRRASSSPPRRRLSPNQDNTSPTSSSGSSSSTPTPAAANSTGRVTGTNAVAHTPRNLSPQHVRKSPDPGLRRNPSAGSGTTPPSTYSGLISVPEEGDTSMDFSTSSLQQPTSASTITARNYGTTSFVRPQEGRRSVGQSPPRYLGGLDLSGDDSYDSEDEDLEDWLIDEELAREGLYRGSYKRILLHYTLTPLTTLIAFTLLSLVPVYLRAHSHPHSPLPEPIPPGSPPPNAPRPNESWSGGYAYTSYLPYPLPELIGGMAVWSLGYLSRQGLAFLGSLLNADDDDEEDEAETARPQGEFELGSQTPRERGAGKARRRKRTLRDILAVSRNTIVGSTTILLQSVLSICLQLVAIVLLGVKLGPPPPSPPRLPPLPPSGPDSLLPLGPRLSPYTPAFARIWYIALGWAAIEAVLGIAQGYANLALYKDVVVSVRKVISPGLGGGDLGPGGPGTSTSHALESTAQGGGKSTTTATEGGVGEMHGRSRSTTSASMDSLDSQPRPVDERQPLLTKTFSGVAFPTESPVNTTSRVLPMIHTEGGGTLGSGLKKQYTNGSSKALEMEVEDDLEELVALKKREELEEMYGMPFIYIPSFISCLHRLNALLFALGSFLLVGAGYLRSSIPPSIPASPPSIPDLSFLLNLFSSTSLDILISPAAIMTTTTKTGPRIVLFFLLPTLTTLLLSILHSPHSPRVLPWIGIHTYVFVSLMVSLGVFFAGLGGWGAVV
ncbi:hypothetical protein BKA70DRAFT_1422764 [Coprinopsis sp. MPI-PUGE-AT-0042]|nr:hypothetical protein BKA70DRAFT_1422764 [Coprinopsis sp. MPI-PUGE-AT-0042]